MASGNVPGRVLLFKPSSLALIGLALSTSVVIATILIIPDMLGLSASAPSAVSWVLRLIGNWIVALVLWFVSFSIILYAVGLIVKGVELSEKGIRVWRFAKVMPWSQVDAISVEKQKFFSALFRLKPVARRLIIFEKKQARKGTKLVPHYLPSFFFLPIDFESMCVELMKARFAVVPASIDVFMADEGELPALKNMFGTLRWQRVALSILIVLSLSMWFYKNGVRNFAYNSGNLAMNRGDRTEAVRFYEWALDADRTFAPAWYVLGNAKFYLGKEKEATQDWQKAIALKPDYVEPRISLSYVALRDQDYGRAKEFLESALHLNPLNSYALLNRAEMEMNLGQVRASMQDARIVSIQERNQPGDLYIQAVCMLARAKVKLGEPEQAGALLRTLRQIAPGERQHVDLRLTVSGETALALGHIQSARKYFQSALKLNPTYREALVGLTSTYLAEGDFESAEQEIAALDRLFPGTGKNGLLGAKLALLRGDRKTALDTVTRILSSKNLDGMQLVDAGNFCLSLHQSDLAALCAQRALRLDSNNHAAKRLLASVAALHTGFDTTNQ